MNILFVGIAGSGKSSLIRSLTKQEFDPKYDATSRVVTFRITPSVSYIDTPGQYWAVQPDIDIIKTATHIVIVCDVTSRTSVKVAKRYLKIITQPSLSTKVTLVLNKLDIKFIKGCTSYCPEVMEQASALKLPVLVCSARDGTGIDELRDHITSTQFPADHSECTIEEGKDCTLPEKQLNKLKTIAYYMDIESTISAMVDKMLTRFSIDEVDDLLVNLYGESICSEWYDGGDLDLQTVLFQIGQKYGFKQLVEYYSYITDDCYYTPITL